jgi:3-carboxy-cis,cis-muconate cycloisomerase
VRRAAIAAPPLGATLHTAAALAVDERPDGAWHVEWATLRTLARSTVVAAAQTSELLAGLEVDAERMAATVAGAADALLAERRSVAGADADPDPRTYLGITEALVSAVLARADTYLEGRS